MDSTQNYELNQVKTFGDAATNMLTTLKCEEEKPTSVSTEGGKKKSWKNWPAVAYEEIGHGLVFKGDSFFDHARELYFKKSSSGETLFDEFLRIYKERPDPVNVCGIRINHALALFLAVKQIQPTLVVESGVNAGVSTYFIRAASPTTKIFAVDPLEKPICGQGTRWIDPSRLTTNLTGKDFVDLMDLDWKGMIERKEIDPEKTLVFLDDHLHALKRIAGVLKHGVRHIVVEDNYKSGEGECSSCINSTKTVQVVAHSVYHTRGNAR